MKQIFLSLAMAGLLFSCESKQDENTETKDTTEVSETKEKAQENEYEATKKVKATPKGSIYKAKGKMPGMENEWLQVEYDETHSKIKNIWYWNNLETMPKQLVIYEQKYVDGEISGITSTISFEGDTSKMTLGLIEDQANLTILSTGEFQDFVFETTK